MGFFNKKTQNQNMTEAQKLTSRYNSARHNILLVIVFTLINCILCAVGSSSYFLFSAAIPYYLTMSGMAYTGRMPDEYYVDWRDFEPFANSFFIGTVVVAFVIVGVYALMWFLSKKHGYGWLVAALLLFVADTFVMFAMFCFTGFPADMILDFVFHVWVLVSLASGIIAVINLKKLPEEEPLLAQEAQTYSYIPQEEMPVVQDAEFVATEDVVEEVSAMENTEEVQQ